MEIRSASTARDRFIEQMGFISQSEGAPRIAGRIFGLLLVEGRPMALQEIAERLQVSKASASTNARLLASRDVLRRRAQPGERQDYYELASDSEHRFLEDIAKRLLRSAALIDEVAQDVAAEDHSAGERVRQLSNFYRKSARIVTEWSTGLGNT